MTPECRKLNHIDINCVSVFSQIWGDFTKALSIQSNETLLFLF